MDKVIARHMVARVEAVKIKAHVGEFFGAIGFERLFGLVCVPPPALLGDTRVEIRLRRKIAGNLDDCRGVIA